MQMKKLLPLLLLFLTFGALSTWYLLSKADRRSSALSEERIFSVKEVDQIGKIFLAHRDGETVTLERNGKDWLYNGKWKARPGAMENLLDAIRRIEIKYKPPQAAVPNMIRNLATEGIKVELYDLRGRRIRAYYIGGGTQDERGTYAIREGFDQPYVAELSGWEGNLRFRYNLKGEDWRDRAVFSENPDRIRQLSIEYPKQKNQSFRLEKKPGGYEVLPFYPATPRISAPYRPGSAEAFLVAFENLGAEAFENDYPKRDSIEQLLPFAVIRVTDLEARTKEVKLYPILNSPAERDPKTGNLPGSGEIERYFASISTGDFMLVQNRVFKKILWAYPFFFEQGN